MATKVQKIRVSNLKAISELTVDFKGCTAIITGGNNKGKSSLLRSLTDRLVNQSADLILRQGSTDGFAEWTLTTGEKLLWNFKESGADKLTYISEKEIKSSLTVELRKRFFGTHFDIDTFLNQSASEQYKQLEKMAGLDFTDVNARYKAAYDDRTYKNKKAAEEKARLLPIDEVLAKEVVPTEELENEIQNIAVHNANFEKVASNISAFKSEIETSKNIQEAHKENIANLQRQIDDLNNRILSETAKQTEWLQKIQTGNEWMEKDNNKLKDESYVSQKTAELAQIRKDNEAIIENNKRIEAKKAYEATEAHAVYADIAVKKIEEEKANMIKGAQLPAGFGFSGETITYNGLPFNKSQLSSSAIYIAALKLAATTLGEVKTLHFDASFLDKNNLIEIEAWANQNDLQLLIERPDFDGGEIKYELIENHAE